MTWSSVMVLGLLALATACPEPPAPCPVGETQACVCDNGASGSALCGPSGPGACSCNVSFEGEGENGEGEGEGEGGEGEGACPDGDGDGFHTCVDPLFPDRPAQVDCNDRDPSVAPGGIDFPDNNRDDDCDDAVDEAEAACACDGGDDDVLAGIGLCGAAVLSSSTEGEPGQRGAFASYFALQGRSADGCFAGLSSGVLDVDAVAPGPLGFDPFVSGLFVGEVQTQQTEATSAVRCTLDGEVLDPCAPLFDLAQFDDGARHVIAITGVDVAGNVEPLPLLLVFGGDALPPPADPQIVVLFPTDGGRVGERTPTLSGTAAPGAAFSVVLTGPDGEVVTLTPVVDESGGWSVNPQDVPTALAPGPWTMSGSVDGGVTLEPALSLDFVVNTVGGDNVPPDTRLVPVDGGVLIVPSEDESTVACTVDSDPIACDVGRLDLSSFAAGSHVVTATTTDPAGNVELVPTQLTLVLGAATNLAVVSPSEGLRTAETRFSILGTAPPQSDVVVRIDDALLPPASPVFEFSDANTASDDNGRFVYPAATMPALSAGPHIITIEIEDFDTGEPITVSRTVVVDATAGDTTPPATIAVADLGVVDSAVDTQIGTEGEDPSTGDPINDPSSVTVELQVPVNALGFEVDLMFVTVEWPEFLCDEFNDAFRLVVESQAVEDGEPTNIALDANDEPITVNVGFFELPEDWTTDLSSLPHAAALGDNGFTCSEPFVDDCQLPDYCDDGSDVGFEGSGSGWLKTRAPVVPGETLRLTFLVYDEADFALDSVAFVDGFQWLPFAPPVGTVKE